MSPFCAYPENSGGGGGLGPENLFMVINIFTEGHTDIPQGGSVPVVFLRNQLAICDL